VNVLHETCETLTHVAVSLDLCSLLYEAVVVRIEHLTTV
jgi:hypothetical protein